MERCRLEEVRHPKAAPGDLVDVCRADSARRRSDPGGTALSLVELVQHDVIRHDEVRAIADEQVVTGKPLGRQVIQLGDQRRRVDDHAVAEKVARGGVEDARRDEVELEVPVPVDDRVAGVVATAVADHEVGVGREVVDHAALALVSPLRPDNGDHGHGAATTTSAAGAVTIVARTPPGGGVPCGSVEARRAQARARTLSKQLEQYTGRSFRGRNGTSAWPPHSAHTAACISRCPPFPFPLLSPRARFCFATARQL
jgi:hypothetical protein